MHSLSPSEKVPFILQQLLFLMINLAQFYDVFFI